MTDTLIKVENVSKKFCRSLKKSLWYGLQDLGNELIGRRHGGDGGLRDGEFWAVKNVSFEVKRGECLGLIGHNGAGKTTLLRMLNGLIKPDSGRIEMHGHVGALIALGAGFKPILTGRENIYIYGSILGLRRRDIDRKIDSIIEFAEIGAFIDSAVQTYSSGMHVRLGFSIAAILLEPDILFLDEILAVGDIGFTIKCLNLMRELTQRAAVVFVSHNMQYVGTFCSRVIMLDHGNLVLDCAEVGQGIDRYIGMIKQDCQVSGTGAAQVLNFDLLIDDQPMDAVEPCIAQGARMTAVLDYHLDASVAKAHLLLQINDMAMNALVSLPVNGPDGHRLTITPGRHRLEIPLGRADLNTGKYSFVVVIREAQTSLVLARVQGQAPFRVAAPSTHWGPIVRPVVPSACPDQAATL